MRLRASALLWVACAVAGLQMAGVTCAAAQQAARETSADFGVNLEGLSDWSRLSPFVDLMKSSRVWGLSNQPWIHTVQTDAQGWPLQDAGVVVKVIQDDAGDPRAASRHVDKGVYRLSFTGRATVRPVASAGVAVRNYTHDAGTNRSTAEVVVGDNATQMMLSFVGTQGGVRDVQLVPANTAPGQVFSAEFRAAVAPFGTLRFMDFLRTNGNPVRRWSERTTPSAATQANDNGGAYEYAIQMANELGKDIWINIPSLADDAYVRSLAELLKQSLAPERIVYVEYSNEVWNFIFPQTQQNLEAAVAEAIAGDTTLTKGKRCTPELFKAKSGDCNPYWAGFFRVGKKSARIAQIFSEVFGAGALNTRVRVVYAAQFANPAIAEQVLKNVATYRGKPSSLFYAVAVAPYFGLDEERSRSPRLDADAIHASLQKSLEVGVLPFFAPGVMQKGVFRKGVAYRGGEGDNPSVKALADYYGIKSFAYEGGPDVGQENVSLPAKFAANVDERMGAKMEQVLQQWYGCGNGLYVHFTLTSAYGRYGYWGLTNDARDLQTAKYRAAAAAARRPAAEYRTCR